PARRAAAVPERRGGRGGRRHPGDRPAQPPVARPAPAHAPAPGPRPLPSPPRAPTTPSAPTITRHTDPRHTDQGKPAMTTASQSWEAPAPALSVRQVLALERVLAGEPEVVAGAGLLDRPVRWVHVAEAADVGVMLSGGEMVLTTGVLLAGDQEKQAEYVRSMHRAEASAVVLGLGR